MHESQYFEEPDHKTKVLSLRKRPNGLKKSTRAWNQNANEALNKLGLQRGIAYVLVYVEDLIMASISTTATDTPLDAGFLVFMEE